MMMPFKVFSVITSYHHWCRWSHKYTVHDGLIVNGVVIDILYHLILE